jgi:hypothetical protein
VTADQAGEPYACCVCGDPSPRCLCQTCREAHQLPDGTLPGWLRVIQNDAKRLTDQERRNRQRNGVTFVPLREIE